MEGFGLNQEITKESILKNKHNKYTATYYLLLKKLKNSEANDLLNAKIQSNNAQPQVNPRGESHSINPRLKQIFEFKGLQTGSISPNKDADTSIKIHNKTVSQENKYIRPTPHRRIYGNSPNTYRDPRAASTGFQGIRAAATMFIPREPNFKIIVNSKNARPSNVRTPGGYPYEIVPLRVSVQKQSPRAGTALDSSGIKQDYKYNSLR